jgi:antitoxin component HigA of HigAB toxin-antitoxin module
MTQAEELALLESLSADVEAEVLAAYQRAMDLMRRGTAPRDAITRVMDSFTGQYAELMAAALSAVLQRSIGTESALAINIGPVSLSRKLYAEAQDVSNVVQGIVQRNVRGYQDAKKLALQLFEGYDFRGPEAEPLQINPENPKLPKYMREILDPDPVRRKMAAAFARLEVDNLSTPALRAAYSELLDAIDSIQGTVGMDELEKTLKTAFFERVRYFAERIARTEAHRAYAQREAQILLNDEDIEYVQIRRSRTSSEPCICDLITGRDQYGLGKGVYPKKSAPNPTFHPFCKCIVSPRLDLSGRQPKENPDADQYFLNRLSEPIAAKIIGSKDKLSRVLAGESAVGVHNASSNPVYRIVNLEQAANAYSATGPR